MSTLVQKVMSALPPKADFLGRGRSPLGPKEHAKSVSVVALSFSHVFLAALHSFATLHLLDVRTHLHSLNALLASLHATTGLHAVNALPVRLVALYGFARLHLLCAFAVLRSLHPLPPLSTFP